MLQLVITIRSVPVWIKLYNIPLYAWSHYGINWLASRVGKFLCMNQSTERLEKINYAKCLVEVKPDNLLVNNFLVKLMDGSDQIVTVEYLWKPEVCVFCREFGHSDINCLFASKVSEVFKHDEIVASSVNVSGKDKQEVSSKTRNQKQVWKKVTYNKNKNKEISLIEVGENQSELVGTESFQCTTVNEGGCTKERAEKDKQNPVYHLGSDKSMVNSFQVLADDLNGVSKEAVLEDKEKAIGVVVGRRERCSKLAW